MKQEFEHLDIERIRKDFPIFNRKINGRPIIFLDSASTTQKPVQVINAIKYYYENYNANIHRGIYKISEEATSAYEESHKKTGKFINGKWNEIIFTKNTTESLNLLAYSLGMKLKKGDEIVISRMEHHSNLVPWQQIAKLKGLKLKYIELTKDWQLDMGNAEKTITEKTKIVSVAHVSNVLGTINPVREIGKIAHDNGALFAIDGAQSVPHITIDVNKLDADFFCFSSHKMLGPTGIGVLYGKEEILEQMNPFLYGGDMIREVGYYNTTFNNLPWKFEAGTPNIAGGIAFGYAIDYLKKIGMDSIRNHEKRLTDYAYTMLHEIEDLEIYGPDKDSRAGVIAFNIKKIHSHDIADILNRENICIRSSHHCAMPLHRLLGVQGSARISFYLYNQKEEIDKLIEGLKKVRKIFD